MAVTNSLTRLFSSIQMISRARGVSFIQKVWMSGLSKTKSIPCSGVRVFLFISPCCLCSGVRATSQMNVCWPILIVLVSMLFVMMHPLNERVMARLISAFFMLEF